MAANLDLSAQELAYWTWAKTSGRPLTEGPPLAAWLTAFFTYLFGDSPLAVRMPGLLFRTGALGLFVVWASDRWSLTVAKRGLWILLGSFVSLAGAIIAVPESFFVFFAVWTMIEADRRHATRTGLALGLALLTKWSALGLVPGVIWAFSTRRRGGPRWGGLLLALFVAILVQMPVIVSSSADEWAALRARWSSSGEPSTPQNFGQMLTSVAAFVSDQVLLGGFTFLGALLIALWILVRRGIRAPILGYNRYGSVRVPITIWVIPFFLTYGICALRGEWRAEWTAFVFLPLAGALASWLNFNSRLEEQRFEWKMLILTLASTILISITLLR
ncbi:MAG TPA: glycosyltransferase family 39 protein [Bdellovibrionota bacterium]|nr:glycosyltransferase family 39 protein [Bdellovibrionota bacterium]